MRFLLTVLLLWTLTAFSTAQDYRPKAGEEVMKVQVEGRGNIFILLFQKKAPKTVDHIVQLVKSGFYDGQRFHRVERTPKPYLVQIGDPISKLGNLDGNGGSGSRLAYEDSGNDNVAGAVGLAHPMGDRDSGDSQFYMLLDRASFLDNNYTVFGKVVSGMETLQKIQRGDKVVSITLLKN